MFQVAVIELAVPVSKSWAAAPSGCGAGYTFFSALNIKLQSLRLYGRSIVGGSGGGKGAQAANQGVTRAVPHP